VRNQVDWQFAVGQLRMFNDKEEYERLVGCYKRQVGSGRQRS
jgi:hypothetical protein